MLGLALEGATLVGCARVGEGMDRLDEATATALGGEAAIPISGAWTFCIMVGACTAALDFERAGEWIARIAGFAERFGSRYMLAFCRAEYGAVHLWGGRWDEAEAMLEASVEDYARSRPGVGRRPARRAGRAAQAAGARRPTPRRCSNGPAPPRRRTCAARASRWTAGSRGRRSTCSSGCCVNSRPSAASTARRRSSCSCTPAWRAASSTRPARRPRRCARSRTRWGPRRCARAPTWPRACSRAPAASTSRARALLEDAVDGLERGGAPFEAARARLELATCLLALGRDDDAAHEAAAARERLQGLGAELDAGRARRLLAAGRVPRDVLTPREREVLRLLADGLTNRQIAERLVVSEHTVHRHVANLLRKLDLPSRTAAAAHAVRSGVHA